MSRELPISFNSEMVRAILDGRKTQTRRPIKPQPVLDKVPWRMTSEKDAGWVLNKDGKTWKYDAYRDEKQVPQCGPYKSPYQVGDRLWVRESAMLVTRKPTTLHKPDKVSFVYLADNTVMDTIDFPDRLAFLCKGNCCPNGCFKELARIWLEVTGVRVERVQNISGADAYAEGINLDFHDSYVPQNRIAMFSRLWNSIYKNELSFESNPFVFVTEFKRIEVK